MIMEIGSIAGYNLYGKDEEDKKKQKMFDNAAMNMSCSSYTTSSLESAAQKACISREKYVASRQEFLRSYNLTPTPEAAAEKKKVSVGNRTKKWFKDNKPNNPLRFMVLCVAPKLDVNGKSPSDYE
ncbi:hypothetical protein TIFTF001_002552 [Ficus carica]|uniref:Uncharacterized protein n=1 Tax=Ficus carica TaxID=3494 RepID=A0AA88CTM7_FICCA|nr:hypothetical protein TIFTF001_002552 [Ficus carica]